jgi:acyl carrier protein
VSATETKVLAYLDELFRELERTAPEGIDRNASLLKSGLLDSHSTLLLAIWIEDEIGRELELSELDLAEAWDTPALIADFIDRSR